MSKKTFTLVVALAAFVAVAATVRPPRPDDDAVVDECVRDCVQMCNNGGGAAVVDDGVLPGPKPAKLTIVCYLDGPVRSCAVV